ncbi:hypothetical protein ABN584_26420 [Gloeocapsa sp. BRSZ]
MSNAPGLTAKKPSNCFARKPVGFFVPQRFRECAIATLTLQHQADSFKVALAQSSSHRWQAAIDSAVPDDSVNLLHESICSGFYRGGNRFLS